MHAPHFLQIEPVGITVAPDVAPLRNAAVAASATVPAFMDYNLFCRLLDHLPETTTLQLQGAGEPLLHLHFFRMVRYASARGMRVGTCSRLTVLPEYRALECVQSGLHQIIFRLDAASAATYTALHGKPRFEKILRNLRRLMHARRSLHGAYPKVHLQCKLMHGNLHELPALVQFAHDEGLDSLSVRQARHAGDGLDLSRRDWHISRARCLAHALHLRLDLPYPTQQRNQTLAMPGGWLRAGSYVGHDGNLIAYRNSSGHFVNGGLTAACAPAITGNSAAAHAAAQGWCLPS